MSTIPGSPYDAMSYREIQAECKKRGLKAMAKRNELSRALEEYDSTPVKNRPRPGSASTLRTATYPPPTPPYDDSASDTSEPPSPQQPSSPANTPKRTPRADVPSPAPRFPVSTSPYVPTDHKTSGSVPGWALQVAFGTFLLLLALLIAYSGNSASPISEQHLVDTLRHALSEYPSGEKIVQALATRQRVILVGPVDKGRDIAKKIGTHLSPHNATTPLVLKEANGTALVEKVAAKLSKNPESVIVINTDVINRENSKYLNMLLDDTLPTLGTHKDVSLARAVLIFLADLAKDGSEMTHELVEKAVRERWDDRVAQRVHPYVVL